MAKLSSLVRGLIPSPSKLQAFFKCRHMEPLSLISVQYGTSLCMKNIFILLELLNGCMKNNNSAKHFPMDHREKAVVNSAGIRENIPRNCVDAVVNRADIPSFNCR